MFGGKKDARPLPTDRVHAMMRSGVSEKDIVRQLKAEGYSFGEIEKSLMAVVKEGAAPLPTGAEMGMPPGPAQMREFTQYRPAPQPEPQPAPMREEAPQPAPEPEPQYAQPAPQYAQPAQYEQYQPAPQPVFSEENLNPEEIMEELIESVAEEKFSKISIEISALKNEIDGMNAKVASAVEKAEIKPAPEIPRELAEKMEALEVRIGGLERAFKQLMPSLAENIEAISKLIAERKRTQMQQQQRPLVQPSMR